MTKKTLMLLLVAAMAIALVFTSCEDKTPEIPAPATGTEEGSGNDTGNNTPSEPADTPVTDGPATYIREDGRIIRILDGKKLADEDDFTRWLADPYDPEGNVIAEARMTLSDISYVVTYEEKGNGLFRGEVAMSMGKYSMAMTVSLEFTGDTIILTAYGDEEATIKASEIRFNGKWLQMEEIVYEDDGITVDSRYTYEYDGNGRCVRRSCYEGYDSLERYYTYDYDANGNRITYRCYNSDGTLSYYYTYDYDANGFVRCEKSYNGDDSLSNHTDNECDENGYVVRKSYFSTENHDSLEGYYTYVRNSEGETLEEREFSADGIIHREHYYHEGHTLREKYYYYTDGVLDSYYESVRSYDGEGNLTGIVQTNYRADDRKLNEAILDAKWNCIRRTFYFYDSDNTLKYYRVDTYVDGGDFETAYYNPDDSPYKAS